MAVSGWELVEMCEKWNGQISEEWPLPSKCILCVYHVETATMVHNGPQWLRKGLSGKG